MTFNRPDPSPNVRRTVEKLEKTLHAANIETQRFWGEDGGAVILTDKATYEVYVYGNDEVIVQMLVADGQGWEDVTGTLDTVFENQ